MTPFFAPIILTTARVGAEHTRKTLPADRGESIVKCILNPVL